MDHAFSYLMFAFSGMLLLFAGLLYLTGDPKLIMRGYAAKMKNPKRYARQFAKVLAIVAVAPILGGLTGLFFSGFRVGAATVGVFVGCIGLAVKSVDMDV